MEAGAKRRDPLTSGQCHILLDVYAQPMEAGTK